MSINTGGKEQETIEALRKKVRELEEAIDVLRQTLLEVAHAQSQGAGWYTRGDEGLYQQVSMWVMKGSEAIKSLDNQHATKEDDNG